MAPIDIPANIPDTTRRRQASNDFAQREFDNTAKAGISCSRLLNSPTLDRIDVCECAVTGNYH